MRCHIHSDKEAMGICTECGKPLCTSCIKKVGGKTFCGDCAPAGIDPDTIEAQQPDWARPSLQAKKKDPLISLVLSFFIPGAGQIYNGHAGKGCILFIAFIITLVTIICPLILWAYGVYDAYTTAVKINSEDPFKDQDI
ncbi:hypothetical protein CUJ83_13555 [Methanocella sp. CWC-04]|uniref:B box-type domain-containing protein n=1 Tax=Methanooceanicella nereidis TaxID=2052831 RepID=A0AAP2W8A2_9EURY|nr:B-box zinc finger protein [Methanocella sp. CWC-04]MCD1296024.1 hypothetical protein [Methanocella sp. CWC-04]